MNRRGDEMNCLSFIIDILMACKQCAFDVQRFIDDDCIRFQFRSIKGIAQRDHAGCCRCDESCAGCNAFTIDLERNSIAIFIFCHENAGDCVFFARDQVVVCNSVYDCYFIKLMGKLFVVVESGCCSDRWVCKRNSLLFIVDILMRCQQVCTEIQRLKYGNAIGAEVRGIKGIAQGYCAVCRSRSKALGSCYFPAIDHNLSGFAVFIEVHQDTRYGVFFSDHKVGIRNGIDDGYAIGFVEDLALIAKCRSRFERGIGEGNGLFPVIDVLMCCQQVFAKVQGFEHCHAVRCKFCCIKGVA